MYVRNISHDRKRGAAVNMDCRFDPKWIAVFEEECKCWEEWKGSRVENGVLFEMMDDKTLEMDGDGKNR